MPLAFVNSGEVIEVALFSSNDKLKDRLLAMRIVPAHTIKIIDIGSN